MGNNPSHPATSHTKGASSISSKPFPITSSTDKNKLKKRVTEPSNTYTTSKPMNIIKHAATPPATHANESNTPIKDTLSDNNNNNNNNNNDREKSNTSSNNDTLTKKKSTLLLHEEDEDEADLSPFSLDNPMSHDSMSSVSNSNSDISDSSDIISLSSSQKNEGQTKAAGYDIEDDDMQVLNKEVTSIEETVKDQETTLKTLTSKSDENTVGGGENDEGKTAATAPKKEEEEKPKIMMYPVEIEWLQGGDKVYVTGSFTGWRKMISLIPDPEKPGTLHVKLQLPEGTHRFRFIVDNELRFSDYLPTATDQTGNFVNYLEVKAPIPPASTANAKMNENEDENANVRRRRASKDIDANLLAMSLEDHKDEGGHARRKSVSKSKKRKDSISHSGTMEAKDDVKSKKERRKSKVSGTDDEPMSARSRIALEIRNDPEDFGDGYSRFHEPGEELKKKYEYTQDIPSVFTDPKVMEEYYLTLDRKKSSGNSHSLQWLTPPQLPAHLESVILNEDGGGSGSRSGKSNGSSGGSSNTISGVENISGALPIPNHVVLNHLVTTSIKHNTLCVASIIRYKHKYATQILYTPLQ
ncbi:protein kinase subunit beta NDAI_0I02890 [Naumovozyma dairenensis CBS 421]|uniref:Association with the SNF1 complex (ASC) domain-containing protein n=1 Tax=Naumovozyma dairenensis (strain ATCC 10597 / BCRC 20456 / CBS 421 / NBRC 0211 / NRRL Y-12639) TaxID=1071378 RepID=G0WGE6_NAUDC|nr:hypothetical protein NDAI_0I02890 [Naumovozyma dairenensis CBS 421]CCD26857.1 hypothetical protein NDAI_0I02890 [Naumovozyma dairenensis CBS 421]